MPPIASWYRGLDDIAVFLREGALVPSWRHAPTHANGQPAVGCYMWNPERGCYLPSVVDVLTLRGERIASVTAFISRRDLPELRPAGRAAASVAGARCFNCRNVPALRQARSRHRRHVGHRRGDRHAPARGGRRGRLHRSRRDSRRARGSGHRRALRARRRTRLRTRSRLRSQPPWRCSAASTPSCSTPACCARRCSRRRPTSSGTPSSRRTSSAPFRYARAVLPALARVAGLDHPRRIRRRRLGRDADRRLFGLEARADHAHAHARRRDRTRRRSRERGLSRRHGAGHGHDGRRAARRRPTPPTGRARRSGGSCTPVTSRRRSPSWPATRPARSRASTCSSTAACGLRCAPTRSRPGRSDGALGARHGRHRRHRLRDRPPAARGRLRRRLLRP